MPSSGTQEGVVELSSVLDERIDWRFRCFPQRDRPLTIGEVGAQGWNALVDLRLPVMTLSSSALTHNIELMSEYCAKHAVDLAPHTKTPLAPQLFQRQLAAGAWAATAATVDHVRILRACDIRRILLANTVVDSPSLAWLRDELSRDPEFEFYTFVDSAESVAALRPFIGRSRDGAQVRLLLEIGHVGGRSGCRSEQDAVAVADAVASLPSGAALAGVAAYEGSIGADGSSETLAAVDRFLGSVRAITERFAREGRFDGLPEVVVSAGGSGFFDRVVEVLGHPWKVGAPVRVVLRSGSYVTHDSGHYERLSPLDGRSGGGPRLRPALEVWGAVTSRPEPDLAILGLGKRDAPYDLELPIPFAVRSAGTVSDGSGLSIRALNDHHAFVDVPSGTALAVGDLVGSRIVHPCTAFDKWRLIPLVDNDYRVIEAIRTFF